MTPRGKTKNPSQGARGAKEVGGGRKREAKKQEPIYCVGGKVETQG